MLNPNAKIFRPNTKYNNGGPRACISDPVRADVAIKTSIKAASGGSEKPALIRSYEPSNNHFLPGPPPNAPTRPRAMTEPRNNNRKNTKNRTNKNTKKNSNKPRKNNITNQYPSGFPRSSRPRLDSVATTILCASPPAAALIFPFPPAPPSISEEESSPSVSADDCTEDFEDAFDVDVNQMVDLACLEMQFDSYVEEVKKKSGRWVESVLSKALEVPVLSKASFSSVLW
jgi:hypothetical protein